MKNLLLLCTMVSLFSISCSSDDSNLEDDLLGGWILETIRVEGPDCQSIFGANVPAEYLADAEGCAVPLEVLGNAKRCVNIELMAGGTGLFKWSEINGAEDEAITYTIEDGVMEYCSGNFACGGEYVFVGDKLEAESVSLRIDQTCYVVYVLRRK